MTRQALIDWEYRHYYSGYSDKNELSALRKLLKQSKTFEDAKFVHEAVLRSLLNYDTCFDVAKGALELAAANAKQFSDYIYVLVHSVCGTSTYTKALKGAEKTAKTAEELERVGKINASKSKIKEEK